MTLLDTMADYQRPPIVASQSVVSLQEARDFERMNSRIETYRIRNDTCVEANCATRQAQMQDSGEKTRFYHEKLQQLKAKKSTKRQRDSSGGGSGQQKRKLSTSKSDGPASKQANTDIISAKEEPNELDGLNLFDGLDKDLGSCLGVNDIMTILEESEPTNPPSVADGEEKDDHKLTNGVYNVPPLRLPVSNNGATSQHSQSQSIPQQTAQHTSNTPSPQLPPNGLSSQQVGAPQYNPVSRHPLNRQMPVNPAMYQVKSEHGSVVSQAPYMRSMSESASALAARQQMQQQLERQSSVPGEYRQMPTGVYPAGNKVLPSQMMSRVPQGVPLGPDYTKSISIPSVQQGTMPGSYYPQMTGNIREYPNAPGYPGYPSQYSHPCPPMTAEEMHRMKTMHQKAQLARSNSHPAMPTGPYTDPRVASGNGYYHMVSEPPVAMQHQASLRTSPMLQQHAGQPTMVTGSMPGSVPAGSVPTGSMTGGSIPTGHGQYSMQSRSNYPLPMHSGVNPCPTLTRHISNHHPLSTHDQRTLNPKISNIQHPAARPMSNTFQMTPQPTMMGALPTYPTAAMRTMNSTNPAMMSQQQPQTSSLSHHMSRPGSAGNAQGLVQNHMISNSHPSSMHPHAMHRPPSGGVHGQPQQMITQTISPPHPQSHTPQAQNHYSMPVQTHQPMHHMPQLSLPQPCNAHLTLSTQHNQTRHVPMHAQLQLQEDLNDLELILSSST